MGDPRRIRKKYSGPTHPWQKARLDQERVLRKEYSLKNKKELYQAESKLKEFANQAKKLTALRTTQAERETKQLLDRLARLGILAQGARLDDVLSLTTRDILERRLQTIVCKKGFARTPTQARQFITHNHITVAGKTMTAPGYLVPIKDENSIAFVTSSSLAKADHPERAPTGAPPAMAEPAGPEEQAGHSGQTEQPGQTDQARSQ